MSSPGRSGAPRSSGAPLRIGFAGTPEFAAIILRALLERPLDVIAVYTQPDRPAGRGRRMQPSPVKTIALERNIQLRQPASLRGAAAQRELTAFNLDVLIVAAYGLLLPASILEVPQRGCINVHASLLPRWRGAAPVERAIMAGDTETGVSIMQMDAGLDTGPVLAQARCPIHETTVGSELEITLANLGARCLLECLDSLDSLQPTPQCDDAATYAAKLTTADARIDWQQPAQQIHRQVRALSGRLPATAACDGMRIKLLEADWLPDPTGAQPGTVLAASGRGIQIACGSGSLLVRRLQLDRGKGRPLLAADAINGYPQVFAAGVILAGPP